MDGRSTLSSFLRSVRPLPLGGVLAEPRELGDILARHGSARQIMATDKTCN